MGYDRIYIISYIVIQLYIDDTSYDTPIIYDTSFGIQPVNDDQ
jgi:hypothetical protein